MRLQENVIATIDACGKGGQWQFTLMILDEVARAGSQHGFLQFF